MTEEELAAMLDKAAESGEQIGWQVLDPDGNVVQSGGVSVGKAAGAVAEALNQAKEDEE